VRKEKYRIMVNVYNLRKLKVVVDKAKIISLYLKTPIISSFAGHRVVFQNISIWVVLLAHFLLCFKVIKTHFY
jgi:hypothetical protein